MLSKPSTREHQRTNGHYGVRLLDQGTLVYTEQQRFELGELPWSQRGAPFLLDVVQNVVDLRVGCAATRGQPNDPCAAFAGRIRSREVPEPLETPQQLIHGLLADPRTLGEHARANAIRPRKLQHRHVWHAKVR